MEAHGGLAPIDGRLDVIVVRLVPELSRMAATRLVKEGRVRVDGVVVDHPAESVFLGQRIDVDVPVATPSEVVAEDLPLRIVYQDEDIVVVDKEAGMVVHPALGHDHGTLVHALLHHVEDLSGIGGVERPGIVHRLDRGTSGLIVVAKHDRAHRALSEQLAEHTAQRTYLAITLGVPDRLSGTIRSTLGRHPTDRMRFASVGEGHGRDAVTHWRRLGEARGVALVAARLETGRTHQIRVHLTEAGWPLAGDPLYRRRGSQPPVWLQPLLQPDRPLLHAWRLAFDHPADGKRRVFEAPPPAEFVAVMAAAGLKLPKDDPFATRKR